MTCIISETDRAAELCTLQAELRLANKREESVGDEGKAFICKQIAQIKRDIARNQAQMKAIL